MADSPGTGRGDRGDVDATIVIPCIEINPLVLRCVSACRRHCPGAEICVVADEAEGLAPESGVTIVSTGDISIAAKRNLAARRSNRKYLACIDSDAYPEAGWLQAATEILERGPDIWIAGGPNVSPPDQPFMVAAVGGAQRSMMVTGHYAFRKCIRPARDTNDLASCNIVMRREQYVAMGGMNESLFAYEDKDLCARVVAMGKRIRYDPRVLVYHADRPLDLFLRQRLTWGATMWSFWSQNPSTTQLFLLAPAAAVLFFLSLPLAWVIPGWSMVYAFGLVAYVAAVFFEAWRVAPGIRAIPGVALAIVIGNLGPGLGAILGPLRLLPGLKKMYRNYRQPADALPTK